MGWARLSLADPHATLWGVTLADVMARAACDSARAVVEQGELRPQHWRGTRINKSLCTPACALITVNTLARAGERAETARVRERANTARARRRGPARTGHGTPDRAPSRGGSPLGGVPTIVPTDRDTHPRRSPESQTAVSAAHKASTKHAMHHCTLAATEHG